MATTTTTTTQANNEQDTQILSQVDLATQPVEGAEAGPAVWGRLYPIGSAFRKFDLREDSMSCGRRDSCDICLENVKTPFCSYTSYSNLHFTITKCFTAKSGHYTLITDKSSNGTFVNGERIGKGRQHALKNNAEISLCVRENKAFVFCDLSEQQEAQYPAEIRNRYTVTKTLGTGAYGQVKLAFEATSCRPYAVKIIQKRKFSVTGKQAASIASEVAILKRLEHPCVIRVHQVIDTAEAVFLVLDLVEGGELFDKIVAIQRYSEPAAKFLFYQMVLALQYLHASGISHRDLKPENILLSSAREAETLIKITDFGLSKFVDGAALMKTFCGTPNYLAPEVLQTKGDGQYTNKVDNWSLGVILYIMLVGFPPFNDDNLDHQIKNGIYDFSDELWHTVSDSAKDVVRRLMCVDATKRASLSEVLEHEWLRSEPDLMERLQALVRRDCQDGLEEKLIKCLKLSASVACEESADEAAADETRALKRACSTGSEASQPTEARPCRQSLRSAPKQPRLG